MSRSKPTRHYKNEACWLAGVAVLSVISCVAVDSRTSVPRRDHFKMELSALVVCEANRHHLLLDVGSAEATVLLAARLRTVWTMLTSSARSASCEDAIPSPLQIRVVDSLRGGLRALATDFGPSIYISAGALAGESLDELEKVVAHEVLHVHVHRITPRGAVPPWFDEGLASVGGATVRCADSLSLAGQLAVLTDATESVVESTEITQWIARQLRSADPTVSSIFIEHIFSASNAPLVDSVLRESTRVGFRLAFQNSFGLDVEGAIAQFGVYMSAWTERVLRSLECETGPSGLRDSSHFNARPTEPSDPPQSSSAFRRLAIARRNRSGPVRG